MPAASPAPSSVCPRSCRSSRSLWVPGTWRKPCRPFFRCSSTCALTLPLPWTACPRAVGCCWWLRQPVVTSSPKASLTRLNCPSTGPGCTSMPPLWSAARTSCLPRSRQLPVFCATHLVSCCCPLSADKMPYNLIETWKDSKCNVAILCCC